MRKAWVSFDFVSESDKNNKSVRDSARFKYKLMGFMVYF
jgi:hypothetical protein